MIGANEKRLKTLQKELAKEYKAAEKEMLQKAEKYMQAFKQADALEAARLAKGEITQAQYEAWRAAKLQRSEWANRMSSELAKGLTDEDIKAIARVNNTVMPAAAEGSMYANFEASRITGKSYTLVSRSGLAQALSGDLYKKKVNIPKDMQWNEKHVRSAITQSLLQGESVPEAAKRLSQVADMNRAASLRDARTMINAAEQGGKLAEYEELAEEGVDIEKGWMATLDERTRDSHAEMDMEYVPVDEPFSNGLMEPCDPSGDPSEVYNCRCTLVSRIDGRSISQEERRSNLDRPYEEWKNRNEETQEIQEPPSHEYSRMENALKANGVDYNEPGKLDHDLSDDEITNRIAGGDNTKGSCVSVACAYVGNKGGLDVHDYRGGLSQSWFSRFWPEKLKNLNPEILQGGGIRSAKQLLAKMMPEKEYMLSTGRHTAIVRLLDGKPQYLELQSAFDNGWHDFEGPITLFKGTPYEEQRFRSLSDTLKNRFGCKGGTIPQSSLIDVDELKNNSELKNLLGYLNTNETKQQKGMKGHVR